MAGIRSSRQGSSDQPVKHDLKPSSEVAAKMQPLARRDFENLLKRAADATRIARKPAAKVVENQIPSVSPVVPERILVQIGLQIVLSYIVVHAADAALH